MSFSILITITLLIFITHPANAQNRDREDFGIGLDKKTYSDDHYLNLDRKKNIQLSAFKNKEESIKQENMSKKIGPLLLSLQARSPRRTAFALNLDILDTLDILAQKDASLFFKPDHKHYFFSPHSQAEVREALQKIRSKLFTNNTNGEQLSSELN